MPIIPPPGGTGSLGTTMFQYIMPDTTTYSIDYTNNLVYLLEPNNSTWDVIVSGTANFNSFVASIKTGLRAAYIQNLIQSNPQGAITDSNGSTDNAMTAAPYNLTTFTL